MRWIAFILLIILFASCTSLKPVISKPADDAVSARNTQPRFIENITINKSAQSGYVKVDPTNKYPVNNNIVSVPGTGIEIISPLQFKYAILMDVPVEQLNNSNSKLLEYIEDWYGTPYHFGGVTKDGIDCSAFAGNLMAAVFGIGLPRLAKEQFKVCRRISKTDLEEGDLVFFHTTRKGVSHVGVYLGNNKFVHASLNYGVTISDMGDGYYARKLVGAGRVKQTSTSFSAN
jgi:cell wall-associated NlpC family hydrolase